jgi:DNA-binding CsgD family transcriptional regulator
VPTRTSFQTRHGTCENRGMSLFLVEHAADLEADAEDLERQAAELRKRAERLSDQARQLRAIARKPSGLNDSGRVPDHKLDSPLATGLPRGVLPVLTARQRQIVRLVAYGRTNRQIAHELVVTVGTAANHVAQVLDRLGLENRVQLAAWAVEHQELWRDRACRCQQSWMTRTSFADGSGAPLNEGMCLDDATSGTRA